MYYVDPSGHFCKKAAKRICNLIDEGKIKGKNLSKLESYLRTQKETKGLSSAERKVAKKLGIQTGGLPDWLKRRFDEGNRFNEENRVRYPYNEVEVYGDKKHYVVDSYIAGKEIVSRKFTQLAKVKTSTGIGYLKELERKYPSGAIITDSPFNPKVLRGQQMTGQLILEIPVQKESIPKNVIEYANQHDIVIRDVKGKEYN